MSRFASPNGVDRLALVMLRVRRWAPTLAITIVLAGALYRWFGSSTFIRPDLAIFITASYGSHTTRRP